MKVRDIIEVMEQHYPLEIQEEWDKCGLQIGDKNSDVNKIIIALNADRQTLKEAIDHQCQMLITHHPFLLDPIHNIDRDHFMGSFIYDAILNNIAVYSSHTSLDKVSMNNWLIEKLNVENIEDGEDSGVSKIADLKAEMSKNEFISLVKNAYGLQHIKYAGHVDKIKRVAICGGSGADFIEEFYGKADAYITGDTKYRHAKNAFDNDILLIDIGHHAEKIMVSKLKEELDKVIDIEIIESQSEDYYSYE
jgi:dinuclear metal center protein, YbgI/SA1388 family